jgi:hypothetical protein
LTLNVEIGVFSVGIDNNISRRRAEARDISQSVLSVEAVEGIGGVNKLSSFVIRVHDSHCVHRSFTTSIMSNAKLIRPNGISCVIFGQTQDSLIC